MPKSEYIKLENPKAYMDEAEKLNDATIQGYIFKCEHAPLQSSFLLANSRQNKAISQLTVTDRNGNSVDFHFIPDAAKHRYTLVAMHTISEKNHWENFKANFPKKAAPLFYDFFINHCPNYELKISNLFVKVTPDKIHNKF